MLKNTIYPVNKVQNFGAISGRAKLQNWCLTHYIPWAAFGCRNSNPLEWSDRNGTLEDSYPALFLTANNQDSSVAQNGVLEESPWKYFWRTKMPLIVFCFTWRAGK